MATSSPRTAETRETITIRMKPSVYRDAGRAALEAGTSRSDYIERAVVEKVARAARRKTAR